MHGQWDVPPLETVTEKLLREEQKLEGNKGNKGRKILVIQNNPSSKRKQFLCHYCGKLGHSKFAHDKAIKGKPSARLCHAD